MLILLSYQRFKKGYTLEGSQIFAALKLRGTQASRHSNFAVLLTFWRWHWRSTLALAVRLLQDVSGAKNERGVIRGVITPLGG